MLHAMSTVKELMEAGEEVTFWFHGIGVGWLSAFDARYDTFTTNYGPLFESVRSAIGGACGFCAGKRFGAGASAERLGIPLVGVEGEHHSLASLLKDGWQVISF
jgi:hypothetical protein